MRLILGIRAYPSDHAPRSIVAHVVYNRTIRGEVTCKAARLLAIYSDFMHVISCNKVVVRVRRSRAINRHSRA
jgi:hypothetical protein